MATDARRQCGRARVRFGFPFVDWQGRATHDTIDTPFTGSHAYAYAYAYASRLTSRYTAHRLAHRPQLGAHGTAALRRGGPRHCPNAIGEGSGHRRHFALLNTYHTHLSTAWRGIAIGRGRAPEAFHYSIDNTYHTHLSTAWRGPPQPACAQAQRSTARQPNACPQGALDWWLICTRPLRAGCRVVGVCRRGALTMCLSLVLR